MILDRIIENYGEDDFLIADGLNEAVIGLDVSNMRLVYSKMKCMKIRMFEGLSQEDALEDLEFNTWSAYVGEFTPIWCDDLL